MRVGSCLLSVRTCLLSVRSCLRLTYAHLVLSHTHTDLAFTYTHLHNFRVRSFSTALYEIEVCASLSMSYTNQRGEIQVCASLSVALQFSLSVALEFCPTSLFAPSVYVWIHRRVLMRVQLFCQTTCQIIQNYEHFVIFVY